MFSFLKFLNSKSDADKNKVPNTLSGKTLNLNSHEARALNIFNNKSPIARKSNGNNSLSRTDCKDTVTSPGFSFRIAQRAREMRSTSPNTDESSLSTSYILENSLNGCNMINGSNKTRDVYDKKRKLMETLDNFGVRKRTRQEANVDSFVNRRRRTISESNAPDRLTVLNGHNQRLTEPSSKCVIIENKKTKRHGDFETNMSLSQKKPRTRNNEILSSYSSSKFLLTPGQKRPYHNDHEDESPKRKHCKSCTCCGSTILLESDQNYPNKRDKTTETDMSDDLVTVAASRIFNRSGKTQVVKKMTIKTILDEVFDDIDPIPYTSIEKLQEKKKKAEEKVISFKQHTGSLTVQNNNQKPIDSAPSVTVTPTSKFNEIQPVVTSILSTASSTVSVTSAALITTPLVQSTIPQTLGLHPSDSTPKVNEEKNSTLQSSFDSSSPTLLSKVNHKQPNEVDKNATNNQIPVTNNTLTFTAQVPSEDQNKDKSDKDNRSIQFTLPVSKPSEPIMNSSSVNDSSNTNENNIPFTQFGSHNSKTEAAPSTFGVQVENSPKQPSFTFGVSKTDEKPSTPVIQFGVPKVDDKQSTPVMQFGVPKSDEKQSTPILQFGAPKEDNKQSTPVMQFGSPKVDDKQSTPVMQFGLPKVDDKQSTPVMQFGAHKTNDKQSTPIMQFGVPKVDEKQSTPVLQFGTSKIDNQQSIPTLQFETTKASENPTSTPALFSFGSSNQKANENTKQTEPVKFQFGSSKPDNLSSTEPKNNVVFGSNNLQNQNIFNFGKTENTTLVSSNPPKYDASIDKSTPKLQFGALPTPVFGTSNLDTSKPQFSSSVNQLNDNQGPKVVFGNQIAESKAPTSASAMTFANKNTTNSIFQFNSSSSKLNDKPHEVPNSSFQFSATKTAPNFGDKPAFQFNVQKTEEPKAQFSSSSFGLQSTSTAPFKFGSNDKPTPFGSTGSSFTSNQPLQFANNAEKTAEPFKFGSTVSPTTNAFQFGANKTDNGPVKFGQTSNTFSTPGFSSFGNSASQQTTFGSVSPPQPSPFGNMTSTAASPTFGSVASPTSNTFGTNQSFQFGSTNNNPSSSSTFAFSGNAQPSKPEGAFNFNASSSTTTSPFQFGQASPALSTPQFGGIQTQGPFGFTSPPMTATVMPGSSQSLFSVGAPPAGERRKAKAVRRRT